MTEPPQTHKLAGRRLYLCTPDRHDLEAFVEACISGGVDIVQLREKQLEARQLIERARLCRRVCADHDVPFILNDRPDLALEVEADGVHVGQDDAPPSLARQILGSGKIVGLSTHAPLELASALAEPVDYLSAGPVVATPTKPGRPGTGLAYLSQAADACDGARMPMFATGDARPATVSALVQAGARRVVAVRWLTEAEDPRGAAQALREALDKAIEEAES
ncbi:MAG TPA: thiamine phosphate synthase [Acidimicrobiales bacterium]|nr:thiamine phosphate synthase [Acidimicrobiales bacterium]